MRKNVMAGLALIVGLSFVTGACATSPQKTSIERSNLVTLKATVLAIDQATRIVTLKGPKGDTVTFKADAAVRNLPQVSAGDEVLVNYYESLVMRVLKPEEAAVNEASAGAARAKAGEMPAGGAAAQVTVTVSIEAIDKANGTVTFKGPSGNVTKIRAADPKNLDLIKVGDRVAVTYSEALAISVDKVKK
jgi:hypothetical protein